MDFADVRAIMANAGSSLMGIGTATGNISSYFAYYFSSDELKTLFSLWATKVLARGYLLIVTIAQISIKQETVQFPVVILWINNIRFLGLLLTYGPTQLFCEFQLK